MHNIAEIERKTCPVETLAVQKGPMHRQKVTPPDIRRAGLNPPINRGKPVNAYQINNLTTRLNTSNGVTL